jgi:hypothetical protein
MILLFHLLNLIFIKQNFWIPIIILDFSKSLCKILNFIHIFPQKINYLNYSFINKKE